MSCLKSASISILVNGSPTEEFKMGRGVRQGDPLSLFLFILATEGLNILTKTAVEKRLFNGVKVGNDNITVSHLQYADDTIFFGEYVRENLKSLLHLLKCFELASGLKINMRKSNLLGVGIPNDEVKVLADDIGCDMGSFPFKYLGFPISTKIKKNSDWKVGKKISWVKWDRVILPFSDGGLSSGSLKCKNLALSGKWWWSIYVPGGGFTSTLPRSCASLLNVWPNIINACSIFSELGIDFKSSFTKAVGNGVSTKFWKDIWLGNVRLADKFNRLFRLDLDGDASVADRVQLTDTGHKLFGQWRREPQGRVAAELLELTNLVAGFNSWSEEDDSWKWNLSSSGKFTTKKLTEIVVEKLLIDGRGLPETIRNNLVPKKIEIFIWRLLKKRLPTLIE
ncbi:uncharacterized protein [Rutidosis leptorrhynchoides]|uniref:uncharacterized protein n=1 Tax=Rutidosis leptorrhynchoides TaxID=125765 RepID=UPI003A990B99